MATYGYVRVSTTAQAEEGQSLEVQQRIIRGYALQMGLDVDKVFVERGVSGSRPLNSRPQGVELLGAVQSGDVVIVSKLDRMFRSASDALAVLEGLKALGVSLHLIDLGGDVTGNGIAKLVFTILSAVAEAERDRIKERITDTKRDQRRRGRYLGGDVPFGYSKGPDGELVENKGQQMAIKYMLKLRHEGRSLREIAKAVKDDIGPTLSHVSVGRIIKDNEV